MNFKLGDFVRFVDEKGEGHITSFQRNDLVGVTDQDGFEIPVPVSKITLVYGQVKRETDDEKQALPVSTGIFVTEGVYLAVTGELKQGMAVFYLVNDTSYQLLFSLNSEKEELVKGEFAALIDPHTARQIYAANVASIANWPVFVLQLIFYTPHLQPGKIPVVHSRKIRPSDLSTAKQPVELLKQKAWLFRLDEQQLLAESGTDKLKEHFMSHRPVNKRS